MNKLPLRLIVFSTFLTMVCGGFAHNEVRAKRRMAGPATDMGPHMSMTKLRPLAPGDQARADAILAAAKKAAERYRDYRKAEADGYTIFMPDQRQNVYHFIRESSNSGDQQRFDPDQPPALLYRKIAGPSPGYELVGVMYIMIIYLTKVRVHGRIPFMDSIYFFFKGLAADAVALSAFRISFLMLASKVLVGTFFMSFFLTSSNGASL